MISVIIPAHNAAKTIGDCVKAVRNQTLPLSDYEVIVVDDGSTDGTAAIAWQAGAEVVEQNRGRQAAARNAGISAAEGDIVCFTDADCFPAPNWLEELVRPFQNPDLIGSKGIYSSDQSELVARFVQLEYEDKYDLLKGQERIDFIDTYSAAYRRQVLMANNCFDETFPYLEDQELSFRLAARGYGMVFQPTAVVRHLHSHTLWGYFRKKFTIGYWKAQVVRRFPTQGVKDSHTPQVMKIQMGLMALIYFALAAVLFTPWAGLPLSALLAILLLTTVALVVKACSKDKADALAAPNLLADRATALGIGYGWGTVNPSRRVSGLETTISGVNYLGKRAMDIAGSMVGLLIALILGPFIALAVKLTSDGPVLFRQERVGQGGKPFTIIKFRSMRNNAEDELENLVDLGSLDEPAFKLVDDPRITPFGRFLRRWSLDELPQFWNVFKGDMSLIGPRPEEARVVALYNDWHRRRLVIKPGITGPMQVNGRGDLPLDKRVKLEIEYIENYSLWRDVVILLKTIPAVFKGSGAR
jgi:lipopolysaccharide/colanic/teichoic acid biosynthesis glycosyltransferase/glycosyltransferase involved in cell wall biosynthesis